MLQHAPIVVCLLLASNTLSVYEQASMKSYMLVRQHMQPVDCPRLCNDSMAAGTWVERLAYVLCRLTGET